MKHPLIDEARETRSTMNVTEIECGRYHNDSDFTSKCRYYFDGVLVPIIATFGVLGGYIQSVIHRNVSKQDQMV